MSRVDPGTVRWLVERIHALESAQARNTGKPQLAFSSIEDGAISGFDREGTQTVELGRQHDGTHTSSSLTGPKPATPWLPTVSAVPGVVEVRWNGKFAGGVDSPMDFKHVAAYVVPVGSVVDLTVQAGVATGELGDTVQAQVKPGVYDVYLAAWSLSGKVSDLAGPVSVVVPVSVDGATLNGKMTVSYNEPTPEDGVGKPDNALWNQIDPDTDGQVAVWRWDGAVWVDMPITETMLPLVNIAEGTYGRLKGVQLEADAIDGMVITGAVVQSPGDGAGYQLTENGYTSRDADGSVSVRLPADGSTAQFRGDLEARSLTASGRVSFQAPENEITSGAALVLESGVQAPASPPTVGASYQTVRLADSPGPVDYTSGLAYADGLWWRAIGAGPGLEDQNRVEVLNATGEVVRSINTERFWARNGLTIIGDELFLLGPATTDSGQRWVQRRSLTTGAWRGSWKYTSYGTGTYQPGLGTDGTNVLIAQCEKGGNLNWSRWNKTTGAFMDDVNTFYPMKSDVVGVYKGAGDFGATRVAVSRTDGTTNVFTTAGVNLDGVGWRPANGEAAVGLTFVGGKFVQQTASSKLVTYSSFQNTEGDTNDWWVAQSWFGPGGAETMAGPPQRFTYMRRSELQIAGAEMPPGVSGSSVYLARKDSTPTREDFHRVLSSSLSTMRLPVLSDTWATRPSPPASNTFANTDPGIMKSRVGGFVARGDGSGSWGPLTFNADGTVDNHTPFRMFTHSSTESVPSATYKKLTRFSLPAGDTGDGEIVYSQGVATVQRAGVYHLEGSIAYSGNNLGTRYAAFQVDGQRYRNWVGPLGTATTVATNTLDVYIKAGGTVEMQAYQASGSTLTIPDDPDITRWSIRKV